MRAYNNIKFIESPDIADIKSQGRKSSVGRIPRGTAYTRYIGNACNRPVAAVKHNDRGYCKPHNKAATRRYLKRADRAISARFESLAEGN